MEYQRQHLSILKSRIAEPRRRMQIIMGPRQVESAIGAHLANRSQLDTFELLYWREDNKKECDYVLKKGQTLVAIEVKSSSDKNTAGFERFKHLYGEHITSAFIVGPEGLPLEDFFALDLNNLFRK